MQREDRIPRPMTKVAAFLSFKPQCVDQQRLRPYHAECPIASANILGIMNTRLSLEP